VSFSTERLARASARHPRRVIGAWLVAILLAAGAIGALLGDALTANGEVTAQTESKRAYSLIDKRLPHPQYVDEVIVVRSPRFTVDDPQFGRFLRGLAKEGRRGGVVADARTYFGTHDRKLVSRDGHATLVLVQMGPNADSTIGHLIDVVQRADRSRDFDVAITGNYTSDRDFNKVSQHDLRTGELEFGLPAALVILVLVFGAVVAGLVPVLLAIVSIIVALGLTAFVGQAIDLSFYVVNMISGMGLALGIDYALFVVSRYREERSAGRVKLDAIAASGATSSRAVFFSGLAFVVSMFGMVIVPDTILRSLAVGAILVGIVSVVAALTLLPAVLSLLGDRVNALRIPFVGRGVTSRADHEGRVWRHVVEAVMRRPVLTLAASVGLLLLAAAPVLSIKTGQAGIATIPDRFVSKHGFIAVKRSFPAGSSDPVLVVIDGDVRSGRVRAATRVLLGSLARDSNFGRPRTQTNAAGDLEVVAVPLTTDVQGGLADDAVRTLRGSYVPSAFSGVDARVLVAGQAAEDVDYANVIRRWLPRVFAFVLGLSFLLLLVVFRSLVVAAKAIVLNLLSVGAAYGLLVLVFQKGVGAGLLGFHKQEQIESWLPLFLFSVLFGLSMDYHVFLLSRIRETYLRTGRTGEAVASAVSTTARLITGAALIIVAVFAGFARGDLVPFQQMGFGVAVSLLIDATLIRSLLLPASMQLLGRWNWYLPRWLDWLPKLQVEGGRREMDAATDR
jgi:uncharacterized membrane protein YdfJ with MMPL/SSD domain